MKRLHGIVAMVSGLAGCASEPMPPPPQAPAAAQYTPQAMPERTASAAEVHGGEAQQFVAGKDIPSQWWTLFRSPALEGLVRQALAHSPSLARARARLRQAEEERQVRVGATRYPQVDAKLSANRVDVDPQSIGSPGLPLATPINLYLASVAVTYDFDVFGATRHELAALQAGVDLQRYEMEGTRLMLAGNVVTAALREASLREQLEAAREIVSLQQRQLAIVERLEALGTAAREDVVAQRLELAQSRVLVPELERQLEQVRHRLAVYTGQPPEAAAALPRFRLEDLQLPAELPLSLPSELARQRPDIRAAQALLDQAGARVGVATANLYPRITLSATLGSLGTHAGDLFGAGTAFYLLGASLAQPVFHGGELQAQRRAAIAAWEQAGAAWQEAVLQGLQEVADVLRALEADARRLQERADAATQARTYHQIVSARYEAGGVSHYTLLAAQRKLQAALFDRTQAVADRYADSAALLQALGGGWWHDEPASAAAAPGEEGTTAAPAR
jgi:NodT family efflux transporter outer membrane factor (OMF) lipoprotein